MGTLLNRRRYMGGGGAPVPTDYIQDGLIFQLDGIDKGATDGTWVDLVGGIVFTNNGATEQTDGFYISSGTYLQNLDTSLAFTANENYTLEAAVNCVTKGVIFASGDSNDTTKDKIYFSLYDGLVLQREKKYNFNITLNSNSIISANLSIGYVNGNAVNQTSATDYWGQNGTNIGVGYRGTSSLRHQFIGKIYAIRVYNRRLSADEIINNQKVDNARFNLGLSI